MIKRIKRAVIGKPLPSWEFKHQRLNNLTALAVFASDSLSSVAYATEEIFLVLMSVGPALLGFSLPISLVILFLLWILILSYRQTIEAYPKGGGAYIVAKENLGKYPSLVAAGSLLLDYILTVAVSIAAGIAALTSAFPELLPYKVIIGITIILIISILNLKGVKESGFIFAVPTYLFVVSFFIMIGVGFFRYFTGQIIVMPIQNTNTVVSFSVFLLLRAFSSGCAALTGIEAVSDGVPAFKVPEAKNARKTLMMMAIILSILFFGITFLSLQYKIVPQEHRTVVSLLAESIFGNNIFFYVIQSFTMLILFLAVNTSFADFPRLCFFLAKDKYMPKQFMQLGERLVFSNGIMFLGGAASVLIIIFGGSVHHLIPLYAVGVFTSFTISQTGMVKRNIKLKGKNWKKAVLINTIGAIMTLFALAIITATKFLHGAWVIVVMIFVLVFVFRKIHNHYELLAKQLSVDKMKAPIKFKNEKHLMIVPVYSFNKGIIKSLRFAKTFSKNVIAVHIDISGAKRDKLLKKWEKYKPGIDLVVLDSPYRVLSGRLMQYIDEIEKKDPNLDVTIVIPEFVPVKWWHNILHNQTGLALKTAIHFRERTSFISVQYHLKK